MAEQRPKVVVVSTFPVHPRAFGGQLRAWHLYSALAPACDVEMVSLTIAGAVQQRIEPAPGVTEWLVPRSPKQARLEQEGSERAGGFVGDVLGGALTPLYTPAYLDALRVALSGASLVILAHPFMLPSVRAVAPGVPWIYDAHNVEVQLKRALLPDPTETAIAMVAEIEGEATRGAALVSACSADDAAALGREYGIDATQVVVVPNGVDVDALAFVGREARARCEQAWMGAFREAGGWPGAQRLALFLGSEHRPNVDACRRMLEVLPRCDAVLLVVAGWAALPFLEHGPAFERAAFYGPFTDDAKRTLLGSAAVGLNPVTRGSGTNLKILEYFAAGVPVVSTPVGARGLDVRDGEHLRIAEPEGFVDAIAAVLAAPDLSANMAERARALAARSYAWPVVALPFVEQAAALAGAQAPVA